MSNQDLTPFETELCRRLQSAREFQGLTQKQVGELAGMSNVTVSHYERGHKQPGLENLVRLAQALQVSCDYLLLGS